MFRCMCSSAKASSLSSVVVVRKNGLILHKAEKDRSASHNVTGIVHKIRNRVDTLGKSLLSHSLSASIGLLGS